MNQIIFTIYIDVPYRHLDNPGSWDNATGEKEQSDKSKNTKEQLALYKNRLIDKQRKYAKLCGADYVVHDSVEDFNVLVKWFQEFAPQISYYDIINFYKHKLMYFYSFTYDKVCYFDLDVVPTTELNLFEEFDFDKFNVGDSTAESLWGRTVDLEWYNACFRSPSSKWYNAQAMAIEEDLDPLKEVFNTGIMFAGWHTIQLLNYFKDFTDNLKMMEELKTDEDSMYPWRVRRSFGYDNETLFSHRVNMSKIPIATLPVEWNTVSLKPDDLDAANLVHVISKDFRHVL